MEIQIRDESIRLGQFLKLSGIVENGAQVKELIADGAITVNGEPETRRGRTLVPGDTVELLGESATVARG